VGVRYHADALSMVMKIVDVREESCRDDAGNVEGGDGGAAWGFSPQGAGAAPLRYPGRGISFGETRQHPSPYRQVLMSDPIQRRLLERELEFMSFFALGIARDLEGASEESQVTLVRGLFAVTLKLSRLLWPFGRRAGDQLAVQEAAELRALLGIDEDNPLAPERTPVLAAALRLDAEGLRSVLNLEQKLLTIDGRAYPLSRLVAAIDAVHRGVHPMPE
jgi:hypothetical protein